MDKTLLQDNSFAQKIKYLRTKYVLSMSELALILNFKNKSTIAQLEATKIFPSYETLMNVANVFAVKIDWLVGRSPEPYDEKMILYLESQIMDINIDPDFKFKTIIPIEYSDLEKRTALYSLSNRANIVFLVNYIQFLRIKKQSLFDSPYVRIKRCNEKIKSELINLQTLLQNQEIGGH